MPPSEYGIRFEDYFSKKFTVTKTNTPEWLKLGRSISDLESGRGGGGKGGGGSGGGGSGGSGGGGGGDGGSDSGEALAVSPKNSEKGTKASDDADGGGGAAEDTEEDGSTPMKVLQGVTMLAAAAGIAAIEMGVLGGPKEDEAER